MSAYARIVMNRAYPVSIDLEAINHTVLVEFMDPTIQSMEIMCDGALFEQLNLADPDKEYDIEIVITER